MGTGHSLPQIDRAGLQNAQSYAEACRQSHRAPSGAPHSQRFLQPPVPTVVLPPVVMKLPSSKVIEPENLVVVEKAAEVPLAKPKTDLLVPVRQDEDKVAPPSECDRYGNWEVFRIDGGNPEEQTHMTFPLHFIQNTWQSMSEKLRTTPCNHKDFRITNAADVTLLALKELYYLKHPGWHKVRDCVRVGMYKETESCGNSSVSMGFATQYFRKNPEKVVVAFLNCGSGGARVQIYTQFGNTISILFEFKPKDGCGPGVMSALHVKDAKHQTIYMPRTIEEKSIEALQNEIAVLLAAAPWKSPALVAFLAKSLGNLPREQVEDAIARLDFFGFVTGSIRESYFQTSKAHGVLLNAAVEQVLSVAKAKPFSRIFDATSSCYFLSQTQEGNCELLGMRTMYAQISDRFTHIAQNGGTARAMTLDAAQKSLQPFVSFGMGQTSVQWTTLEDISSGPQDYFVLEYPFGMNHGDRLPGFAQCLTEHYNTTRDKAKNSLGKLVKVIEAIVAAGATPCIAMKSGTTLWLQRDEHLRHVLCDKDTYAAQTHNCFEMPSGTTVHHAPPIRVVLVAPSSEHRVALLWRPVSLSKMCADAQQLFGVAHSFVSMSIDGQSVSTSMDIEPDAKLQFASANRHLTWWPNIRADLCLHVPTTALAHLNFQCAPTDQFGFILTQFASRHELTSYECLLHVYRLLWDPQLPKTLHKDMLAVAEQWFQNMLTDSQKVEKLKQFMVMQNLSEAAQKMVHKYQERAGYEFLQMPVSTDAVPQHVTQINTAVEMESLLAQPSTVYHIFCKKKVAADTLIDVLFRHVFTKASRVCVEQFICAEEDTGLVVAVDERKLFVYLHSESDNQNTQDFMSRKIVLLLHLPLYKYDTMTEDEVVAFGDRTHKQHIGRIAVSCGDCVHVAFKPGLATFAPSVSKHRTILRRLISVFGVQHLRCVQWVQRTNKPYVMAFIDRFCVEVAIEGYHDDYDELFLERLRLLDTGVMDDIRIASTDRNLRPRCSTGPLFLPCIYGDQYVNPEEKKLVEEQESIISLNDVHRVVAAICSVGGLRVVKCDKRVRMTDTVRGERSIVSMIVRHDAPEMPVFHELHVCVTSPLQTILNSVMYPSSSLAKPCYADTALENRAKLFSPPAARTDRFTTCPFAMTQGPGDATQFQRHALVLFPYFREALLHGAEHLKSVCGVDVHLKANCKSSKSLDRKLKTDGEYNSSIVPLSAICEFVPGTLKQLHALRDEEGSCNHALIAEVDTEQQSTSKERVEAMIATLLALQKLFVYECNPRWNALKGKLRIGFVKNTTEYGNTSVAQGAAELLAFTSSHIGLLNFGTSGVKCQLYAKKPCVHQTARWTPEDAVNVNQVNCGFYVPASGDELSWTDIRKQLTATLEHQDLPWRHGTPDSPPVYAWVTGPLRDAWETSASNTERERINLELKKLFDFFHVLPLPCVTQGFFLTKAQEAMLEVQGAKSLYRNLERAKQLSAHLDVIGCFGVGRSTRAIFGATNNRDELFTHGGMDQLQTLTSLPEALLSFLTRDEATFERFLNDIDNTANPVLALKAGSTLLLENEFIRGSLLSPASFIYDYCRATYELNDTPRVTPVVSELEATLATIQQFIGPIVRVKDQTQKGFLLCNVLFWHAMEEQHNKSDEKKSAPEAKKDGGSHTNLALLCEVQIRVAGGVDDHMLYEIRRNLIDTKPIAVGIYDFVTDACNWPFVAPSHGQRVTFDCTEKGGPRQCMKRKVV